MVFRFETAIVDFPEDLGAEDIWNVIVDFENYKIWNSVSLIELLGSLQVGTDILIKVTYPGLESTSREMISLLEKPYRIGWTYRGLISSLKLVTTQRKLEIKCNDQGKKCSLYDEISFAGPLAWIAWMIKEREIKFLIGRINANLATYCRKLWDESIEVKTRAFNSRH